MEKYVLEYMEEMEQISAIRLECARREIEAYKVLFHEVHANDPYKIHPAFRPYDNMRDYEPPAS